MLKLTQENFPELKIYIILKVNKAKYVTGKLTQNGHIRIYPTNIMRLKKRNYVTSWKKFKSYL